MRKSIANFCRARAITCLFISGLFVSGCIYALTGWSCTSQDIQEYYQDHGKLFPKLFIYMYVSRNTLRTTEVRLLGD